MFGSQILDIAIGIVFVFLLFSLICSAGNELLASLFRTRADFLERGLRELLNEKDGRGLMECLFNHGLIYSLFRGEYIARKTKNFPAYIPARNFALALMDALPQFVAEHGNGAAPRVSGALGALASKPVAPTEANPINAFRNAVERLPNAKVREPLLTLIDSANGDAVRVRTAIEGWYNSAMDRVSGAYKSRSGYVLFGLGFLAATLFNADSISLTRQFSNDMALRQALVAAAQERAKQQPAAQTAADLKSDIASLEELGLPIGWSNQSKNKDRELPAWNDPGMWIWLLRVHFTGWLLTAVAVSLGAPFWFDLLNKIIVVRSTVKPHEKSGEETSKD